MIVNLNSVYFSPVVEETPVATTEVTSEVNYINNLYESVYGLTIIAHCNQIMR